MGKKSRGVAIYAVILIAVIAAMVMLVRESTQTVEKHTYSEIMSYFDDYKVGSYTFDLGTGELILKEVDGVDEVIVYNVPNVSVFMDEIQLGDENYRKE